MPTLHYFYNTKFPKEPDMHDISGMEKHSLEGVIYE